MTLQSKIRQREKLFDQLGGITRRFMTVRRELDREEERPKPRSAENKRRIRELEAELTKIDEERRKVVAKIEAVSAEVMRLAKNPRGSIV